MDAMILYSGPLSLFARKVEIALAEKSLAYQRIEVPFTQVRGYFPKNPDVLAANPKGQVPVLKHGDLTLYDSTVILEYLEDAFPAPPLYPSDVRERAKVRQLELEADEVLLALVRPLMFRTEPPGDDAAARMALEEKVEVVMPLLDKAYQVLNDRLQGTEYLSPSFSVADIATFMTVHYAARLGGPSLEPHTNLLQWYRRCVARPAFKHVTTAIAAADRELSHPVATAFMGIETTQR